MPMHPIDGRYRVADLEKYFSEDALLQYILKIELAHILTLQRRGILPAGTYETISGRAGELTGEMWEAKQKSDRKYKHNIIALKALINEGIPPEYRDLFHLGLTSYDAIDNAYTLGLKDATYQVVIPDMISFGWTLLYLAERHKSTIQAGRSHGQHGEPTTFGRELAYYLDRWGDGIKRVYDATDALEGKIAGAMGTKASLALLGNPNDLEREILESAGLSPSRITTQIVQPEDASNYYSQLLISFGTLEDLANDMRQLARTEIGEYALESKEGHGRSSAMPHKGLSEKGIIIGNPEDFENICGQYRAVMPHIISVYLNQQSEHNRDIRNSAPERYYKPEILNAFVYSIKRANDAMTKLRANEDVMRSRVENAWKMVMEPAAILLTLNHIPDAQDYVRRAEKQYGDFKTALEQDPIIKKAIEALPDERRHIFESPVNYIGDSVEQTDNITWYWDRKFKKLEKEIQQRGVLNGQR